MLVLSLLLIVLLLVCGMGLMSVQRARYAATSSEYLSASAFQLARAGLEDARIKLERTQLFPPNKAVDQTSFTYCENVALSGGQQGAYFVKLDFTYATPPMNILTITSTGTVGPIAAPLAQRALYVELDQNPNGYNGDTHSYWHFIHFQDLGST